MEQMTPEERFVRIENALEGLAESQARHDTQIGELIARMEKQDSGIRDLIVVSRTLIDSQQTVFEVISRLTQGLDKLTENVDKLTGKVDKLTDNIDKLIRGRGPNGNL